MNVISILKQVPDLVEELELNETATGLNREWIKYILNEYDDHALEQALLLKEQYGGNVKAIGLAMGGIEESLFNAAAKGADEMLILKGSYQDELDTYTSSRIFKQVISQYSFDLILTGVQTIDDRDGSLGPMLAGLFDLPYVGVVHGVRLSEDKKSVIVGKEYPGGLIAEISISLPAVLGIQASTKPPRYVPIAKIRQAQKTAKINEIDVSEIVNSILQNSNRSTIKIKKMSKPEPTTKAEILEGSIEEISEKLVSLFVEKGILR